MLANLISEKYLFYLFYAFSIIGFIGLWFSPFLVSLSTVLIALSVLPFLPSIWRSHKLLIVLMLAMLGLVLFDFMRTENHALVSAKLLLIIGFIFMQLAALHHLKDKTKESVWLILVFSCMLYTTATASSSAFNFTVVNGNNTVPR